MTQTKTCTKCHIEQPTENFSFHLRKIVFDLFGRTDVSTRHPRCKTCHRLYYRQWYLANVNPNASERRRGLLVDEARQKQRVRSLMSNRIKSGKAKRLPCEVCGVVKTEAHHADYSQPFNVMWLCRKHHAEIHGGYNFRRSA